MVSMTSPSKAGRHPRRALLVILAMLFGTASCRSGQPAAFLTASPLTPNRFVTDLAGVLSPEDASSLEAELSAIKRRGVAEIVIYIAPMLPPGQTLEDFTFHAANSWGIGDVHANDGIIIFVFMAERKVRIELGLGVSEAISDEAAARIIAESIAPAFRQSAYASGLRSAVHELVTLLLVHQPGGAQASSGGPSGAAANAPREFRVCCESWVSAGWWRVTPRAVNALGRSEHLPPPTQIPPFGRDDMKGNRGRCSRTPNASSRPRNSSRESRALFGMT